MRSQARHVVKGKGLVAARNEVVHEGDFPLHRRKHLPRSIAVAQTFSKS